VGVPARALGLVFGYAADVAFAYPRRGHPVAGFGKLAATLERTCWADDRTRGAAYTGVLVGGITSAGWVAQRATRERPVAEAAIVAVATWAVLGGRSLIGEGLVMQRLLEDGDLPGPRCGELAKAFRTLLVPGGRRASATAAGTLAAADDCRRSSSGHARTRQVSLPTQAIDAFGRAV
jgi:CobD/Cbib protein